MVVRRLAIIGVVLGLGCSTGPRNDNGFGSGADGGDTEGDDGDGDGDDDDAQDGDAGDESGSSGGGDSSETEDTAADSGDAYDCEITIACHDGSAIAGAGANSVVPIGCGGLQFTNSHTLIVSNYADPEAPRSIPFLADFDDDGNLDLLVNFRKASVGYVFAGNGDGRFTEPPAGSLAGGLFAGGWGGDIGDIDGDGALDILLGDHTRSARAWVSTGGMAFAEARTGLPDDVWLSGGGLADVNGDGHLDAFFGADQFSSGITVYSGDGNGSWTPGTAPASSASNIGHFVFADYDGDGDLDVFAFGKTAPGVTAMVFRNDGGAFASVGEWTGGTSPLGADPLQGSVGDVDCDGDLDIAAGGSIFLGDGTTWAPGATVDGSQISQFADMNGDGNLDLVTHDASVGLALYLGDGTGTGWTLDDASGLPGPDDGIDSAYGIEIGDLDNNDALDIVRVVGKGGPYYVEAYTR
jgi:hypothetical protein